MLKVVFASKLEAHRDVPTAFVDVALSLAHTHMVDFSPARNTPHFSLVLV